MLLFVSAKISYQEGTASFLKSLLRIGAIEYVIGILYRPLYFCTGAKNLKSRCKSSRVFCLCCRLKVIGGNGLRQMLLGCLIEIRKAEFGGGACKMPSREGAPISAFGRGDNLAARLFTKVFEWSHSCRRLSSCSETSWLSLGHTEEKQVQPEVRKIFEVAEFSL